MPANCASSCTASARGSLSRQGFRVSAEAQSQRNAGIVFHEARAAAANRARSPWAFWWAIILAGAGIAILIVEAWRGGR